MPLFIFILQKVTSWLVQNFLLKIQPTDVPALSKIIDRILIIQLQYLGDSLIFTPTLRAIHKKYPTCTIDVVVNEVSYEVYKDNPHINKLFVLHKWVDIPGRVPIRLFHLFQMFMIGTRNTYDCVLMDATEAAFEFSLLAFMTRIKHRIGFKYSRHNYLNTFEIDIGSVKNENCLSLNLKLAELLGACINNDHQVELHYSQDDKEYIDSLLAKYNYKENMLIGINPFAKKKINQWPYHSFNQLLLQFNKDYPGARLVVIGGKQYVEDALFITKDIHQVINLVGKTTLSQLAYLTKLFDLFITLDSGPMHLYSLSYVPTICLISGRNLDKQWTYHYPEYKIIQCPVSCSPCYSYNNCPHGTYRCIQSISVKDVFSEAQKMLQKRILNPEKVLIT